MTGCDERMALRHELSQRERELDAVWRVTQALASATDETSLARMALHVALGVVGAEAGSILLHDPARDVLVFRHVEGGAGSRLQGQSIAVTEGIAGEVFSSRHARISPDVAAERAHARALEEAVGYATRNMITVPLSRFEGHPAGVMQVLNKRIGELDEHDLRLLETLGSQVAMAIEQARLCQEAKLAEVARLLRDIGHDLKNMITPVVMSATMLESIIDDLTRSAEQSAAGEGSDSDRRPPSYPPGTHTEAIAILRDAARRVQDRVKEIADCVAGVTVPPRFAPCDVNEVASQVVNMLRPVADHDQIALDFRPWDGLPPVEADSDRLYSMLYNLTDNAMTAVRRAQRSGRVAITTTPKPSPTEAAGVVIEVNDTGCGMRPETLELLFSPEVRTSTPLGSGLGTKIVKNVVEMHGGRLDVASTFGVGTTFRVELPVSQRRE